MGPIEISTREAIVYSALLNAAIGFVLGLIPLLFGYFKGKLKIGVFGILSSTIGGAILGVFLSVPAMVIFTWLVVRASKTDVPVEASDTESENN